jgi:hypothetical protein
MHCCIYIYRLDELRHSAIATSIVVIGWIQKMNACAHLVKCPHKIYMPSWECQNADCRQMVIASSRATRNPVQYTVLALNDIYS